MICHPKGMTKSVAYVYHVGDTVYKIRNDHGRPVLIRSAWESQDGDFSRIVIDGALRRTRVLTSNLGPSPEDAWYAAWYYAESIVERSGYSYGKSVDWRDAVKMMRAKDLPY